MGSTRVSITTHYNTTLHMGMHTVREQREAVNSINLHEAAHSYFGDSLVVRT